MAEYRVCPCCDAGRDAYDAAEAVDPTSAEYVEETCDDCMGGKACTVPMSASERTDGETS